MKDAWDAFCREFTVAYHESYPQICEQCGNIVPLKGGVKAGETRRHRFCSRRCSATFNGLKRSLAVRPKRCVVCGDEFAVVRGHDYKCCPKHRNFRSRLGSVADRPISAVRGGAKYQKSAAIRTYARAQYIRRHGKDQRCVVCGYDKHTEVCHIKPIREFPSDALVRDVNATENLAALCPTHHWEFDHGLIDGESLRRLMVDRLRPKQLCERSTRSAGSMMGLTGN